METRASVSQLILVPAVITLAVTALRLVGELQHWSEVWFNPKSGGWGSIIGITWLAPVFGIYFASKLSALGQCPPSVWRAMKFALLGAATILGGPLLATGLHLERDFHARLLFGWAIFALAALFTLPGWPALFRALLAYGCAARVPVAIIMFFAFRGNWGTHYDALPRDAPASLGLSSKFLWLGLFPQLILWVGYTIVAGALFGTVAVGLVRLRQLTRQTTP